MKIIPVLLIGWFLCASQLFAADTLKAFPAADTGMTRHVIELPQQTNENELKVELLVGKVIEVDAVNQYSFGGSLHTEVIPGWGFERYVLPELGPLAGTLMAPAPGASTVARFITAGGEPRLLRYNSRLPLVVYTPADVEVRHRVWQVKTEAARFTQKVSAPHEQTVVIAEGEFEARSLGSYSVRLYSGHNAQSKEDTTFFSSGLIRVRDGQVEKAFMAELQKDESPCLVVVIRSAGSGSFLSADAFSVGPRSVVLRTSVSGLAAQADPVDALRLSLKNVSPR